MLRNNKRDVETGPLSLFTFSTLCITKDHKHEIRKNNHVRVDIYSFANRVFAAWNNLPATVVDAMNVNGFRTH